MGNFRTIDRETGFLLPPSVDEWLPEKHLARFVVEVVEGLDLRAMSGSYRGSGSASYHPRMLLGLLVYGYATGVFSSRKLERATHDSVAFRFIAANDHPDHDTIATFRRRFLAEIEALFVRVLLLAREMGVLKMGSVAQAGRGAGEDRGAGQGTPCARAGGARSQARGAAGEGRGEREKARRQASRTPGRGAAPQRPDQPDRRGVAHHAGGRRRLRPMLQRPGRRGGGKPAGGGERREPGAQRQAATRTDAGQDRGSSGRTGQARMPAGGYRLFQRGECRGLRRGGDRTADRHGPSAASSTVGRALPSGAGSAARSNPGRGHGASAEDAGRPGALRAAQADAGAGVRNHQIGAGIPSIFAARPRGRARRMEPRHHGLEHQAVICPRPRLTRLRCAGSADRPQETRYPALQPPSAPDPTPRSCSDLPKPFSAINRNPQSDRLLERRLSREDRIRALSVRQSRQRQTLLRPCRGRLCEMAKCEMPKSVLTLGRYKAFHHELTTSAVEIDSQFLAVYSDDPTRSEFVMKHAGAGTERQVRRGP